MLAQIWVHAADVQQNIGGCLRQEQCTAAAQLCHWFGKANLQDCGTHLASAHLAGQDFCVKCSAVHSSGCITNMRVEC